MLLLLIINYHLKTSMQTMGVAEIFAGGGGGKPKKDPKHGEKGCKKALTW